MLIALWDWDRTEKKNFLLWVLHYSPSNVLFDWLDTAFLVGSAGASLFCVIRLICFTSSSIFPDKFSVVTLRKSVSNKPAVRKPVKSDALKSACRFLFEVFSSQRTDSSIRMSCLPKIIDELYEECELRLMARRCFSSTMHSLETFTTICLLWGCLVTISDESNFDA